MQPIKLQGGKYPRFVKNKLVDVLYEFSKDKGMGMCELVGYSLSGYSELRYVQPKHAKEAFDNAPEPKVRKPKTK